MGYIVLAADLLTGIVREEIPFDNFKFSHQLNAPGAFTGQIGLTHPKATQRNLSPGATALHVVRNGVVVWSGIMWTARPTISSQILEVGAEGWWSYLRRRLIRSDAVFTSVDQLTIARSLVTTALAATGSLSSINTPAPAASGVLRTQTWHGYERKYVGYEIEQLAAQSGGFDFSIDCAYSSGVVTKTLNFYYPRRGVYSNMRVDLGYNVQDVAMTVDASLMANLIDAAGAGTTDAMLYSTSQDTSLLTTYPLLEDVVSYKSDNVQAVLDAHAASSLLQRKLPVVNLPVLLDPSKPDGRVGSFGVGDTILVTGSYGWINVSSQQRIMSYEVTVDNSGREQIALTTVADTAT